MSLTAEQLAFLEANPGFILRTEFLEPSGISQAELARRTGIPASRWTAIIRGRRAITPETAIALAALWKIDPRFWLNLQTGYDLRKAELRVPPRSESGSPPSPIDG